MRILLDECVNPRLRLAFPGDEVNTVSEMGWRSLSNGELLKQATGFDVFITIDQSVHHQNPTHRFPIGILILADPSQSTRRVSPSLYANPRRSATNAAGSG
jgi:predicted nuclease of predicted toxin-antitoxin system